MKEKFIAKKNILIMKVFAIFISINAFPLLVLADGEGESTCESVLSDGLIGTINKNLLVPLKVIAPILLLVLTTLDFAKVVFSDNKDGMSKAWKNFIRRAIGTLLVFFASNIVGFIYGFIKVGRPCFDFF